MEPGGIRSTTPGTLVLPRKGPAYRVKFALEGCHAYETRIMSTKDVASGASFTGFWTLIDGLTGADRTLYPDKLHANLLKMERQPANPPGGGTRRRGAPSR